LPAKAPRPNAPFPPNREPPSPAFPNADAPNIEPRVARELERPVPKLEIDGVQVPLRRPLRPSEEDAAAAGRLTPAAAFALRAPEPAPLRLLRAPVFVPALTPRFPNECQLPSVLAAKC